MAAERRKTHVSSEGKCSMRVSMCDLCRSQVNHINLALCRSVDFLLTEHEEAAEVLIWESKTKVLCCLHVRLFLYCSFLLFQI